MHYSGGSGDIAEPPNNLPEVINGLALCFGCTRHIEPGNLAFRVEKPVGSRPVGKSPDNLPDVVNTVGCFSGRLRHVNISESSAGVNESPSSNIIGVWQQIGPDDLSEVVDAIRERDHRGREIKDGNRAVGLAKKPVL